MTRAYEDTDADGGIATALSGIISNENLLLNLSNLIENEKWTSVILYFKCNREDFLREYDDTCERESSDVLSILNIYCKRLVLDKPGRDIHNKCQYFYGNLEYLPFRSPFI